MSVAKNAKDWFGNSIIFRMIALNKEVALLKKEVEELRLFKQDHTCDECKDIIRNDEEDRYCIDSRTHHCQSCTANGIVCYKVGYICDNCEFNRCARCYLNKPLTKCTQCNNLFCDTCVGEADEEYYGICVKCRKYVGRHI